MKISNILKVADVENIELFKDFIIWLANQQCTYSDQILKEHLYNVDDLLELENLAPMYTSQLQELKAALSPLDCSYFRVVYN